MTLEAGTVRTFPRGGIHPAECKQQSQDQPITTMDIPATVVLPVSQHLGAPCEPVVAKGDRVLTGQLIAAAKHPVSARIHSSVTGTVKNIGEVPHPLGPMVTAITITSEAEDEWAEGINPAREYVTPPQMGRDECLEHILHAGIVGMGGAAFPSQIRLSPPPDRTIDTVIFNGAECEPYLTADHRLMVERPARIIDGAGIIMKILGVKTGIMAIESNKPDALKIMAGAAGLLPGLEVVACQTKYPQGGEKQLIRAITGREVPSRKLPMDVGVVVHNVGTCAAIYEAVTWNRPLVDRVVTVAGPAVSQPANLMVRLGTSFGDILEWVGCKVSDGAKVLNGGPMMGRAIWSLNSPVIKGTSGILVFEPGQFPDMRERNCVRCGNCVRACPMGLAPVMLAAKTKAQRYGMLPELGIFDCIECGSCSYVCGSNQNLVQWFRVGKLEAGKLEKKR